MRVCVLCYSSVLSNLGQKHFVTAQLILSSCFNSSHLIMSVHTCVRTYVSCMQLRILQCYSVSTVLGHHIFVPIGRRLHVWLCSCQWSSGRVQRPRQGVASQGEVWVLSHVHTYMRVYCTVHGCSRNTCTYVLLLCVWGGGVQLQ